MEEKMMNERKVWYIDVGDTTEQELRKFLNESKIMNEFNILVSALAFLGFILCISYLLALFVATNRCTAYREVTGRETKMGSLTCFIKVGDSWYLPSEVKVVLSGDKK